MGAVVGAGCLPYAPVFANAAIEPDRVVHMAGDGTGMTPREYAALLNRLCQDNEVEADNYLLGGEVEAFEKHWAQRLGKETAVFMPSGTLANQLALRVLAGSKRRVIVPEMSHIYNDTGDACQTLSGLTLLPLAAGRATFTRADVEAVIARTSGGRVATDVGAIVIESPIRRLSGQMFDWDEARRISALARDLGIGMHLDGARLFIASAYTGISPAEYSAQFDTVYVSLWKYFNCGIGAILAGPKRVLDGMFHTRRMFGGNLAAGWNCGGCGAALHGRLRAAADERGEDLRDVLLSDGQASTPHHRAHSERHQPDTGELQGRERRGGGEATGRARHRPVGARGPGDDDLWRERDLESDERKRFDPRLRAGAEMSVTRRLTRVDALSGDESIGR